MSTTEPSTPATQALRAVAVSAGYGTGQRSPLVVRGIELAVAAGQTVGVVGESGCGKSTLARVLAGQIRPRAGQILLGGTDLGALRGAALRRTRRRVQLVPQDPYASLDPRMAVGRAIDEAISPDGRGARHRTSHVAELLRTVALDPDAAGRFPHEFSGGQRQRIALARALAVRPDVIVADEITSSLDSSVQAEVLNLLRRIQERTGVAVVFITHDLSVANYICHEVYVLYAGRLVEHGSTRMLFEPAHPYTRLLVESIPRAPSRTGPVEAPGEFTEAPDPANPPAGCPFHPRCAEGPRHRENRELCISTRPELRDVREPATGDPVGRSAACHFPLIDEIDRREVS